MRKLCTIHDRRDKDGLHVKIAPLYSLLCPTSAIIMKAPGFLPILLFYFSSAQSPEPFFSHDISIIFPPIMFLPRTDKNGCCVIARIEVNCAVSWAVAGDLLMEE